MQDSLFLDTPGAESTGTLDAINDELLCHATSMPQFEKRVFIFGEGPTNARAAVVGDSPGPPDIESGRPFMGPVGQMLDRMLSSIGLARHDCYITNLVKIVCTADEVASGWLTFFRPYLHRELLIVRPRVVITFGNNPTRALLNTTKPISQLRAQFHDYKGIPLMPTFNPAYLLRDPMKKREVWEDLKKVRALLSSA